MTDQQLAHILRMEAIDILLRTNVPDDRVGIDVLGQRHLHENAVHRRVTIQLLDERQQRRLCRIGRQTNRATGHARFARRPLLGAHIGRTGDIVAHEDHRETGHDTTFTQRGHIARHIRPHVGRDRLAVDQFSAQNPPPGSLE